MLAGSGMVNYWTTRDLMSKTLHLTIRGLFYKTVSDIKNNFSKYVKQCILPKMLTKKHFRHAYIILYFRTVYADSAL